MFRARYDTLALNEMVLHETFYLAMFKLFGNDGILKSLGRLVHQALESFTKVLVTILIIKVAKKFGKLWAILKKTLSK